MNRPRLFAAVAVATAVLALDQLSKHWALAALADGPIHVGWTLDLDLSFNSGVAFGLGRGGSAVLVVAALALVVVVAGLGRTALASALGSVALGLVVGGAAGNLVDRTVRDQPGVIDFIDLGWWPVFNLADAAISLGVVLLLLAGRPAKVPVTR